MCNLSFLFYLLTDGYTTDDIVYLWKYGNNISVEVNKDVRLAQFDLISVSSSNHSDKTVFGNLSTHLFLCALVNSVYNELPVIN